jgi:hypothetical protein
MASTLPSWVPFTASTGTGTDLVTLARFALGGFQSLAANPMQFSEHRKRAHENQKQNDDFRHHAVTAQTGHMQPVLRCW